MYSSSSSNGERVDLAVAFPSIYIIYWLCILPTKKLTQATDTITTSARLAFLLFFLHKILSLYLPPYLSNNFIILLFFFMIIIIIFSLSSQLNSALFPTQQPTNTTQFFSSSFFYSFLHSTLLHLVFLSSLSSTNDHDCHKREGKLI